MFARRNRRFNRRGFGAPPSGDDNPFGFGSSLKLWLDATDLTVGTLTTWTDKSGEGNDGTAVSAPAINTGWTGGLQQVVLDGIDDLVEIDSAAAELSGDDQPYTIMAAFKMTSLPAAYEVLWGSGNSASGAGAIELYRVNSTPLPTVLRFDDASTLSSVAAIATPQMDTSEGVWSVNFTGTAVDLSRDGVLWDRGADVAHDVGVLTTDIFALGCRHRQAGDSLFAHVAFAEVLIWNVSLTAGEQAAEEARLKAKWGTP